MKKQIVTIVSLCFFVSCNRATVNNEVEKTEIEDKVSSFMEIISTIPDIKLPYTIWCGIENGFPVIEDFKKDILKMGLENSVMVGKLPIDNDYTYILYGLTGDIIYPYLNIYDKNGQKLDAFYLHISYCGADGEIIETPITTINKDFSIHMVDTTEHTHYIENDNGYEKIIDSIIVSTRKMALTKDGYYKITKETTQQITY